MRAPLLAAAACWLATLLAAAEQPIPVVEEPMHRTVFENDTVRVIDVQIPPGATSLFHTHVIPSVIVYLTKSTNRSESWPDGAILTREVAPGQSRYAAYDTKPLSHRVTNTGTNLFRVLDIELLRKPPAAAAWPAIPSVTPQWTEPLVRSTTLELKPGATVEIPATSSAWLVVATRSALQLEMRSEKPVMRKLQRAEFQFVPGQTRFELKTASTDLAEAVLLELR